MKIILLSVMSLILIGCNKSYTNFEILHEGYVYETALKKEKRYISQKELSDFFKNRDIKKEINPKCNYIFVSYGEQSSQTNFDKIIKISIEKNQKITIVREPTTYTEPPMGLTVLNSPFQIIKVCN